MAKLEGFVWSVKFYSLKKSWQICSLGVFFKTFELGLEIFLTALAYSGA